MRGTNVRTMALAAGLGVAAVGAAAMLRRRFDFSGRRALVTGGSRGLGLVLARRLAAQGADVAICARHTEEAEVAGEDIAACGEGRTAVFTCDVSDEGRVREMVDQIRTLWGGLDAVINNAGVIRVGPMETMTADDVRESLDVHVMGPLHTMLAVLPEMMQRGEGRIVNISSIGGLVGLPHLASYCAGKHGLVGLSRAMQMEAAAKGVRITTVCPGLMRTGSPARARFKGRHRAEYAWFSIGDSLPLVTMSANRAARRILEACRRGSAQVTLGLPARSLAAVDALAPNTLSAGMAAVNRLLPDEGGIGTHSCEGRHSTSKWSPSLATLLSDRAAVENNEILVPRPRDFAAPLS